MCVNNLNFYEFMNFLEFLKYFMYLIETETFLKFQSDQATTVFIATHFKCNIFKILHLFNQ